MNLQPYLPAQLQHIQHDQTLIPRLARDEAIMKSIADSISRVPTNHVVHARDARNMMFLEPESVHLVVTSPPYWTLKKYNEHHDQLGHVQDYDEFLSELDRVWRSVYSALVPGGRLVCVVGDVCLSRRKNNGVHSVVPLHASIQEHCRRIGYTNLSPILWYKIANASYEAGGGGFLGKPYEPNAVIKNDVEFILMQRKPGGYRKPDTAARLLSIISSENYQKWFQQIWTGLTGASTRDHPAPYPTELAERLIRMFSFVGDTVLDPFLGTGTTTIAAARAGRNSIGVEVDPDYFSAAESRLRREFGKLSADAQLTTVCHQEVEV